MACPNPAASQELVSLEASADASSPPESGQQRQDPREQLKALFRELMGLLASLRVEEDAHDSKSDAALRVREARVALEKSLASHGLVSVSATAVAPSHARRESIKSTKRFISNAGASQKATLLFGKR
jgi:hypothetical protein